MRIHNSVILAVAATALGSVSAAVLHRVHSQAWAQPDVGCVEELYPTLPTDAGCANLGEVSPEKRARCDLLASVREEAKNPGVQMRMGDWLTLHLYMDRDKKIDLIYSSAEKYGMPPQFLYGVINLEAMITDLGVIRDGENYSCGTGSLNIWQWCRYMSTLAPEAQTALGWPVGVVCNEDSLSPAIVGSVFENADFSKSSTVPNDDFHADWQIQLRPREADAVPDATILNALKTNYSSPDNTLPDATRLLAIRSFTRNCGTPENAIPAIAYSLRDIFDRLVPRKLQNQQLYRRDEKFERACAHPYISKYYPLHPGWLLAYGIHNQGEDLGSEFDNRRFMKRIRRNLLYSIVELRSDLAEIGGGASHNVEHVVNRMAIDGKNLFQTGVTASVPSAE